MRGIHVAPEAIARHKVVITSEPMAPNLGPQAGFFSGFLAVKALSTTGDSIASGSEYLCKYQSSATTQ